MCLKHTEMSRNRLFQCFSIQTCTEKAYFIRFQYVLGKCTFSNEEMQAEERREEDRIGSHRWHQAWLPHYADPSRALK